jgi:hypothetical protein
VFGERVRISCGNAALSVLCEYGIMRAVMGKIAKTQLKTVGQLKDFRSFPAILLFRKGTVT